MLHNIMLFFWKFDTPHPPPRNANNVEPYIFVMLFKGKSDTLPPLLCYVTLEWPFMSYIINTNFKAVFQTLLSYGPPFTCPGRPKSQRPAEECQVFLGPPKGAVVSTINVGVVQNCQHYQKHTQSILFVTPIPRVL